MLIYRDKCFVVISGMPGWGQKCSKASGTASVQQTLFSLFP